METRPGSAPDIATADEVLATFTELMRGEKSAERLKAAEQLAKYHSLFTPKEESAISPSVAAEVDTAVAAILARRNTDAKRCAGAAADPARAGRPAMRL